MKKKILSAAPVLFCLDLEGVLIPEIWIAVAKKTRLKELERTTRDEPDYQKLMRYRMDILRREGVGLESVLRVIKTIQLLSGARAFLDRLRKQNQVIILSDTFSEFASPLMQKLGYPTIFCNSLLVDREGFISGFTLRQTNGKEKAVRALQSIGFQVRAAGDSYNDIAMLKVAERGVFFNPPKKIQTQFPSLPVTHSYADLYQALTHS